MKVLRHKNPDKKTVCLDFDGVVGIPTLAFPKVTHVSMYHIWLIGFLNSIGVNTVICTARDDLRPHIS